MKKYIPFILALIAALILLQTLYFKFSGHKESVELFTKLGAEPYGRYIAGIAELLASVLLLIPKTRSLGGLMGMGIMIGAIAAHLFVVGIESNNDGGQLFFLACLVFACCAYLGFPLAKTILRRFSPF
jgi:putative oxidoreductase